MLSKRLDGDTINYSIINFKFNHNILAMMPTRLQQCELGPMHSKNGSVNLSWSWSSSGVDFTAAMGSDPSSCSKINDAMVFGSRPPQIPGASLMRHTLLNRLREA